MICIMILMLLLILNAEVGNVLMLLSIILIASQFTSWRDRGVPVEPGHIVQLVQVTSSDQHHRGLYQEHPKHHRHHHDQLNNGKDNTIAADASAEPSWSERRSRREGTSVVGSL